MSEDLAQVGTSDTKETAEASDVEDYRVGEDPEEKARFEHVRALFDLSALPHARGSSLKGTGGVLKEENSYFNVDEVEAADVNQVAQNDAFDFAYVRIRRSGLDTRAVVSRLTKLFGLSSKTSPIGYAGLKDKYACTCQLFSIPVRSGAGSLTLDEIKTRVETDMEEPRLFLVGNITPGKVKLKPGMLVGNRFRILVTELSIPLAQALERAQAVADSLKSVGVPNYFGPQRLGEKQKLALAGYGEIRPVERFLEEHETKDETKDEKSASKKRPSDKGPSKADYKRWLKRKQAKGGKRHKNFISRWSDRFAMHAFQSGLFNLILAKRIKNGLFRDAIGDLCKWQDGEKGRFIDTDEQLVSQQEARDGLSFTLPIIGRGYRLRDDFHPKRLEKEAIEEVGLNLQAFSFLDVCASKRVGRLSFDKLGLKITPIESTVDYIATSENSNVVPAPSKDQPALLFEFSLPKNVFATSVLREFMDNPE